MSAAKSDANGASSRAARRVRVDFMELVGYAIRLKLRRAVEVLSLLGLAGDKIDDLLLSAEFFL